MSSALSNISATGYNRHPAPLWQAPPPGIYVYPVDTGEPNERVYESSDV